MGEIYERVTGWTSSRYLAVSHIS